MSAEHAFVTARTSLEVEEEPVKEADVSVPRAKAAAKPPSDASWLAVVRYELSWPPSGGPNRVASVALLLLLAYAVLLSLSPSRALPPSSLSSDTNLTVSPHATDEGSERRQGGDLFALFILLLLCYVAGAAVELLRLPPLLGMLVMGLLCGNVPGLAVLGRSLDPAWSAALRQAAFTLILLQGGLSLDVRAVRALAGVVVRLAFCPCVVEAGTVALASYFLLGLPPLFGFLLGFVLGAVSPAVTVPCMVWLEARGLGAESGIGSLVIAASSTDDVLAITAASALLSAAFAGGQSLWWTLLSGPLHLLAGVAYGLGVGTLLWLLPSPDAAQRTLTRTLLLVLAGLAVMLGSGALGMEGAGAVGALLTAATATAGWERWDGDDGRSKEDVAKWLGLAWALLEPALFGLIGAQVDVAGSGLGGWMLARALAVVLCGLVTRTLTAFVVVGWAGLGWRERLFVALAWLPKATVQAALGPWVLDAAVASGASKEVVGYGWAMLGVAVLGILVTAPLGAALIYLSGPRLLTTTAPANDRRLRNDGLT